jgi:hypothetical protein
VATETKKQSDGASKIPVTLGNRNASTEQWNGSDLRARSRWLQYSAASLHTPSPRAEEAPRLITDWTPRVLSSHLTWALGHSHALPAAPALPTCDCEATSVIIARTCHAKAARAQGSVTPMLLFSQLGS